MAERPAVGRQALRRNVKKLGYFSSQLIKSLFFSSNLKPVTSLISTQERCWHRTTTHAKTPTVARTTTAAALTPASTATTRQAKSDQWPLDGVDSTM